MPKNIFIKRIFGVSNFVTILIIILVGILFFYLSELTFGTVWKAILNNIGAALLISGVFTAVNDFFMKDKLVELIFKKLKLKEDIQKTGIDETILDITTVDYGYYIKNAKNNIDVFHTYGESWTKTNHDHFVNKLRNSSCKIRVFLISPDSRFLPALAQQYNTTEEELKATIERVKTLWESINELKRENKKSGLKLYFHDLFPARTIYRVDDQVIVVDTRIMPGRSSKLPVLICSDTKKSNDFFDYYVDELNEVASLSKEHTFN
ncbi:hypothetical protein ABE021_11940 [Sporosarcina gallistercoris]|uniref:hypothetical protein n=1 Tax=Sporosarcina gallistercoris TaxID=2762245 RepID=UPI003D26A537